MGGDYHLRLATRADALLLATQRVAMFRDMGRTTAQIEGPLLESCSAYFDQALATGEYTAWVMETGRSPRLTVAGAGVQFRPLLPRTDPAGERLLIGREGLILNVYVDAAHRRRGLARTLMQAIIAWAPGAGIVRLVLHASDEGRPLYESLGFLAGNEMLFPPFPPADGTSPP